MSMLVAVTCPFFNYHMDKHSGWEHLQHVGHAGSDLLCDTGHVKLAVLEEDFLDASHAAAVHHEGARLYRCV